MRRAFLTAILCAGTCLFSNGWASAQVSDDFTLRFGPSQGAVGGEANIHVLLDAAQTVSAWSLGVCHGPEVDIVSVVNGSTTQSLEPLALNAISLAPGQGWTAGVLIDFIGLVTLPPGNGYALHTARYSLSTEGDATLAYCDTVGSPPVQTVITIPGGATLTPQQEEGTIVIGLVPPIEIALESVAGVAGETVTIPVRVTNPAPFDGFAMGFAVAASEMTVDAITPGAALVAATGGLGPDFFATNLAPTGGEGATVACLLSLTDPVGQLPAGTDQDLVVIEGTLDAGLGDGSVTIAFTDALGLPPVLTRMTVDGVGVAPIGTDATISVSAAVVEAQFVRGDVVDDGVVGLGDAITLVNYLFSGSGTVACEVAADFDDDGSLGLSDVVNLLGYLFSGGDAPGAPFPDCGLDPTPDSLTCDVEPSCA
ncbi:MAG: hypothetical protein ACO4CW_01325 [Planctomycetota bacterium]